MKEQDNAQISRRIMIPKRCKSVDNLKYEETLKMLILLVLMLRELGNVEHGRKETTVLA